MLKELVEDDIEQLNISKDRDAKIGPKTADTSFLGYKTHLAMTEERIITVATITTGEKHDGKQLEELVRKSEEAGIDSENIISDTAYSEKENLKYAKANGLKLISKLSKTISH